MMDPEESDMEETSTVSKQTFDSGQSSPVAALGGWASGAGNALFAVTKGVSSRVEGVSFRMSARAKGMLSSIGDEDGDDGRTQKDAADANGESHGPTVDENKALKLASVLAENSQLAEKIVAMNKMSDVLGNGAGKGSQNILRSVAVPLVTVLRDAEHFDPFFANACIACAQQVSEAQGEAFSRELVEAGAVEALIPLLHPSFELVRIQGLALLGGLLAADRGKVCSRVVGVPTGMQALVDILDDRWDEVRHEAVFLIAAFLAGDPNPDIPLPVDLQNFVAFQEGFENLFRAAAESSEQVSLRALEALRGALIRNPLSQKLFVSGGYLARLPPLLAPIDPAEISDLSSIQAPHQHQQQQQVASNGRRWGGWGGGKDKGNMVSSGNGGDVEVFVEGGGEGEVLAPPSPADSPPKSSSSLAQQVKVGGVAREPGGEAESGSHEREISVATIRATLLLVSALVGVFNGDGDRGHDADNIRGLVAREPGLMEAVCELALASSRAPATGGPTWAEYGVPEDCQRLAAEVLGSMISSHSDNQALFGRCSTRGAPIAVTLHGRKRLIVAAKPRSAVDGLLGLWLAASLDLDESEGFSWCHDNEESENSSSTAEVESLDKLLDAFLLKNESWCLSALAAVPSMHHASALNLGHRAVSAPTHRRRRRDSQTVENGDDGDFDGHDYDGKGDNRRSHDSDESVSGAEVLSMILRRGLLASNRVSHETAKNDEEVDDPTAAALSLRLFRRVLQAGGAGARALAAGIGIATEGADRREEAARSRRESEVFSGQELYQDDSGAPIAQTREWGLQEPGGDGGPGAWLGVEGGGGGRGVGAGLPCGPPLTPALEVAVRLLADGYNVVVTMQRGVVDAGDDEPPPPPADLTRYLISLAELLVAWMSPPGAGPALSRRLLASGANWALLRTLGKALCPASSASRKGSPREKAFSSREVGESLARAAEEKISEDSMASLAYLHSVVTVIVGSFLASAEALTRKTLSAGVAKHVGLFRFCRALDSATDWVSFAEMKETGGGRGRRSNVPSFWALSGDAAFTSGMVAIIHSAQTSVIERIAGVPDLSLIATKSRQNAPTSSVKRKEEAANGGRGNGHQVDAAAGYNETNGAAAFTFECNARGEEGAYEELLRRQQLRIEELECRLLPPRSLVMNTADPCIAAWEEVGLSALRPSLDQQALAIAENQESSLETRKALAAQAKAFRLSVEAEFGATSDMRTASGALVRSFKAEIDSLTTRSRFAENAFLALYKLLREAPDPAVTVKALESTARAAFEALEGQNRSLDEQRQEASRQLEALRASTAARGGGSLTTEELQEERRVLREEIAAEQAETEQARLQALQDAVQEELLMAQRQAEHERSAGQAQLQVLQQEVERLEARAALVEEEAARAAALEEGASAREELLRTLQEKVESLEAEHAAMSTSAEAAFQARDEVTAKCEEAQARAEGAERAAEERARALEAEVFRLRRELGTRADAAQVEAMREQIRILEGIWGDDPDKSTNASDGHDTFHRGASEQTGLKKGGDYGPKSDKRNRAPFEGHGGVVDAVEHGGEEESRTGNASECSKAGGSSGTGGENVITEGEGDGIGECGTHEGINERVGGLAGEAAGNVEEGEGGGGTGVDAWLISYNRRLKNELQRLRNKARLAEERLEEAEGKRAADAAELVERRNEVKRLEQDLVDAHQVVEAGKTMLRAFQSGAVSKQFGKLIGKRGGGATLGGVVDDDAEARRGLDEELMEGVEEGGAVAGVPGSEGFSTADRLLGAVKRQRDRFRKEALRREREASIAKGNAEHLARDNQELRRENMHLYKKMRYVMSYGGKGGDDPDVSSDANRATERKYERLYEDGLDPFREFDSQEKAVRRSQMGVVERWLLWASGAVLRNRVRRYLLVLYLVVLHAMLLMMRS